MVGIQRRGVPLARRIAGYIQEYEGAEVPVGVLDITFYRDDLSMLDRHPILNGTDVPFALEGRRLVLVDDVLYTGRTVRAAIEALMDMGRADHTARGHQDRGHRELPSRPTMSEDVPTSRSEKVRVS